MNVAIVHDYLTQRGGAERSVLSLLKAFPGAPLYTSLYAPNDTFPEFRGADVRTLPLDRLRPLRRNHRLAFPLLAASFSSLHLDVDLMLCSSSGWSHGARTSGRKIVYCHSPAKWLYEPGRYLGGSPTLAGSIALRALRRRLLEWDRRAAAGADRYLVNSSLVARQVSEIYGVQAEVVGAPQRLDPGGSRDPVPGLEPGFFLCVSRPLPYKNTHQAAQAFGGLPVERLVVVGASARHLRAPLPRNVRALGVVPDAQLRWLYANCTAVVAPAYEDFGLTPLEGAAFGKPAAALRWGGYLDTVLDGRTGTFFDRPAPREIADAIRRLRATTFDLEALRRQAEQHSEQRFIERIRSAVDKDSELGAS